jgi:membrane protein
MSTDTAVGALRRLRVAGAVVRGVVELARERGLPDLAAAVAYYAFVSTPPLLLVTVSAASTVGGQSLAARTTVLLGEWLSESGRRVLERVLAADAGRETASAVGGLTLAWGALSLVRALVRAFDDLYGDGETTPLLRQVWEGLVVLVAGALAVGLVVAVGVGVLVVPVPGPLDGVLGQALLVAGLAVVLLPVYYVLAPVAVTTREVLPGAVVAAVGWGLLQSGFQVYAAHAGRYGVYGVIGTVLLFVTWLYVASVVVLLGGAVNAVARQHRAGGS